MAGHEVPEYGLFTRYGFFSILTRAVQVSGMVFGVALVGCSVDEFNAGFGMMCVIFCSLAVGYLEPAMRKNSMYGCLSAIGGVVVYFVGCAGLRYFWNIQSDILDGMRGISGVNVAANQTKTGQTKCLDDPELDCYRGFYCHISGECLACDHDSSMIPSCDLSELLEKHTADGQCATTEQYLTEVSANNRDAAGEVILTNNCCNMQELEIYTNAEIGHPDWRPIDGMCCRDYGQIPDIFFYCWMGGTFLGTLTYMMDPEGSGVLSLRGPRHDERVQKTARQNNLSEADVIQKKIAAVWRWMDYFEDGSVEPHELYRLAQRMEGWLVFDPHRPKVLRPAAPLRDDGQPSTTVEEDDGTRRPREKLANYHAMAKLLGVAPLSQDSYDRTVQGLEAPPQDSIVTWEQFRDKANGGNLNRHRVDMANLVGGIKYEKNPDKKGRKVAEACFEELQLALLKEGSVLKLLGC